MISTLFLVLSLIGIAVGIGCFIRMAGHIQSHGVKVNWFLIRLLMPKYVGDYRRITVEETGHVGPFFLPFALGMNGALVFGIVGLVLRDRLG